MAIYHLATCMLKAGNVEQAIEEFKRCEQIKPSPSIHDGLGCAFHALKDHSLAISEFDKAIQGEPSNIQFYKNRAQCYFSMNMYE